jgi:endonuclease-3
MTNTDRRQKTARIWEILAKEYEDACTTLEYISPPQFLFANIMSPQTTDKVVNQISKKLCEGYESVEEIAQADEKEIQEIIRPVGFFRVKTKRIIKSAQLLHDKFDGQLPNDIKKLQQFHGIGRKTALVILKVVFDRIEGIIIDTHNIRIANRLDLVDTENPDKIEQQLMELLPKRIWGEWSDLMVFHGRAKCRSNNPLCCDCPILQYCDFGQDLVGDVDR